MMEPCEVSIVMPCLNEAETLARCIEKAKRGLQSAGARGETSVAAGKWIIMGDADDSYDFSGITGFLKKLGEGFDLVMCRPPRGGGTIMPDAMPWKNRWLGNPMLSSIGRLFDGLPGRVLRLYYFNLIGAPGWFVKGRVLKQTRHTNDNYALMNAPLPVGRPLERLVPPPLGMPGIGIFRKD